MCNLPQKRGLPRSGCQCPFHHLNSLWLVGPCVSVWLVLLGGILPLGALCLVFGQFKAVGVDASDECEVVLLTPSTLVWCCLARWLFSFVGPSRLSCCLGVICLFARRLVVPIGDVQHGWFDTSNFIDLPCSWENTVYTLYIHCTISELQVFTFF